MRRIFFSGLGAGANEEGAYPEIRNRRVSEPKQRETKKPGKEEMRRIFFIWLGAGAKEEGAYIEVRN